MAKTIHILSRDSAERAEQARVCYALHYHAEIYSSAEELFAARPTDGIVLIQDEAASGGATGFIKEMARRGMWLPVIATARTIGSNRVVAAIKGGALDYLALPLQPLALCDAVQGTETEAKALCAVQRRAVAARARLAQLTPREREVLECLAAGSSNKIIARDLSISPRTVEIHRANMMAKLGAGHAADAVRMQLEAAMTAVPGQFAIEDRALAA